MQSIAPTSLTSSSTSIITSAVQAPLPVNLIPPMYTSHMYSVPALPPLQSGIHPLFPNPAMLPLQSAVSSNSIVNPLSSLSSLYSNRSPAITNDLLHNLVSPNPPVSSNAIFDTPTTAYGSGTSEQQVAQMQNIDPNQQMVVVELNDGQTMKVTWAEYQQISLGFTNGPRPELPTPEQVARYRSLGLYSSNPPQNNAISTRSNITQPITSPASIATIPQQPVLAGNDSHLIPAPVAAPIISPMAPTVPSDYLLTGPNTPIVTTLSVGTGGNLHTVPNVPSSSTNEYKKKPDCTTTSTNDRNDNSRSRSTSPHDLDVEGTDDSDRNEFAKSQNSINTWMNTNEFQSDRDDDENDSCISIDKMAGSSNQNRINRQRPSRKPPSVNMDEIFGHSQESNSMHGSSIQSPSPTDDEPESSNSLRRK